MYEQKDLYIVDFQDVKHYLEIHTILKEGLCFPDYYGRNWDAFWDCLTDMYNESEINIEINNLDVVQELFPTAVTQIIECLTDFKHNYNDEFSNLINIKIQNGNNVYYIE